ncbi:MAG: hypothetical protein HC837_05565, partial [Chloroflexaceae bacterium]|nr:hypothetical protein [Chloroflexaceae bacterium]
ASLFAYVFFGEMIDENTIYGSIFIFGAVLVVSIKRKKPLGANALPPNLGQL